MCDLILFVLMCGILLIIAGWALMHLLTAVLHCGLFALITIGAIYSVLWLISKTTR